MSLWDQVRRDCGKHVNDLAAFDSSVYREGFWLSETSRVNTNIDSLMLVLQILDDCVWNSSLLQLTYQLVQEEEAPRGLKSTTVSASTGSGGPKSTTATAAVDVLGESAGRTMVFSVVIACGVVLFAWFPPEA